jgi:hypothetical protein
MPSTWWVGQAAEFDATPLDQGSVRFILRRSDNAKELLRLLCDHRKVIISLCERPSSGFHAHIKCVRHPGTQVGKR